MFILNCFPLNVCWNNNNNNYNNNNDNNNNDNNNNNNNNKSNDKQIILFITSMICKGIVNKHECANDIDYNAILDNGDESDIITVGAIIIIAMPNVDKK